MIAEAAALDLSVLLGDWRNTNSAPTIARIVCDDSGDGRIRVTVDDWGTAVAPVFAFEFDSAAAGAFNAIFRRGDGEVRMQANVKQGVLVVATFTSGHSNHFNREFFYRR